MDGFEEQYRYATALYLLPMLSNTYSIIIDCSVGAPGHNREVVAGMNAT